MNIPEPAKSLLESFRLGFTEPSFKRVSLFTLAIIVTVGAKTVSNILRTVAPLQFGHFSTFNRIFSKNRYRAWALSRALTELVIKTFCSEDVVRLAGDDTVDGHKGKKVFGKGCHRDAVRSTHKYTAFRWGHKWVVLSILIKLPMTERLWALPCMVALYRTRQDNEASGRRHKTPPELMRQMLIVIMRWFPRRKFIFCGDQGFGTHDLASLGARFPNRISVISKFYSDANLFRTPPPRPSGAGRPRVKGEKLPSPESIVKSTRRRMHLHVKWYGGGERDVGTISQIGCWYRSGSRLTPLRWVYVEDRTGTHRAEYFYSTGQNMKPADIIESYTARWSIEVTFEEMRSYLGLETTRGWTKKTVLRMAPLLFALYSIIVLLFNRLPESYHHQIIQWTGKRHLCFSDVIANVRCWIWEKWIFENIPGYRAVSKLPRKLKLSLLHALAPAA